MTSTSLPCCRKALEDKSSDSIRYSVTPPDTVGFMLTCQVGPYRPFGQINLSLLASPPQEPCEQGPVALTQNFMPLRGLALHHYVAAIEGLAFFITTALFGHHHWQCMYDQRGFSVRNQIPVHEFEFPRTWSLNPVLGQHHYNHHKSVTH